MVSADRRSTEKAPVPEAERIRRVVIPANHWGSLAATQNLNPSPLLAALVTKGLQGIANARLRDYLNEQPMARTVAAADYTVSALLAWNEETSKAGNVIPFTRDDLVAWFPTSATFTKYATKGKQIVDTVGATLYKLAAKNHGLKDADTARRCIAWLDTAVAANDTTAAALVERLSAIITNMEAKTDTSKIDINSID
jgi:hypothetical protein